MAASSFGALSSQGQSLRDTLEESIAEDSAGQGRAFAPDLRNLRDDVDARSGEVVEEVAQHLCDLGYLKRELDRHGNEPAIRKKHLEDLAGALTAFYRDLDHFDDDFIYRPAIGESGVPSNRVRDQVFSAGIADPLVIRYDTLARLRALTTLDGVIEIRRLPPVGATSLCSRVLQHLLRTYGLISEVGQPYGTSDAHALEGLHGLLGLAGPGGSPQTLNVALRFESAASDFVQQFSQVEFILPAPAVSGTAASRWQHSVEEQVRLKRQVVWTQDSPDLSGYQVPSSKTEIAGQLSSNWNYFGIRFLQIGLWRSGYYLGEVDGIWGSVSQTAYDKALEENGLEVRSRRRRVIRNGRPTYEQVQVRPFFTPSNSKQYLLVDVSGFLRECILKGEHLETEEQSEYNPDGLFQVQDEIERKLTSMNATTEQREDVWSKVFQEVDKADRQQRRKQRRKYYGLRAIGAGIRRIVAWVKSAAMKIVDFVKSLLRKVAGATLLALRFLKRGAIRALEVAKYAVRRSIHLLTGKPYCRVNGVADFILTKFSIDQDAFNLVGSQTPGATVRAHFREIDAQNRALSFVVRLGARIVKIYMSIQTFNPFALARLAWQTIRETWEYFRRFQERVEPGTSPAWRTGMLLTT